MVLNECVFSLNLVGLELKPSFPQLVRVTRPVSSNLCRQELSSLLRGLQRMGVPQIGLQATLHFYTDILKSDLFLGDKTRLKALCTVVTPNKLQSRKYTHTRMCTCVHIPIYLIDCMFACAWTLHTVSTATSGRESSEATLYFMSFCALEVFFNKCYFYNKKPS